MTTAAPPSPFRAAIEAHDLDATMRSCSPDVVLHSPISRWASIAGQEQVREVLSVPGALAARRTFLVRGVPKGRDANLKPSREGRLFGPFIGPSRDRPFVAGRRPARRTGKWDSIAVLICLKPALCARAGCREIHRLLAVCCPWPLGHVTRGPWKMPQRNRIALFRPRRQETVHVFRERQYGRGGACDP